MEEVDNGCIVKTETVVGDTPVAQTGQELIKDVTEWFDNMVKEGMDRIKPVDDDVKEAYVRWDDSHVKTIELDRINKKMIEAGGTNESHRVSLENYIADDDETLPQAQAYTTATSLINYDTTLAWVGQKLNAAQLEQITHGARFLSMALHWMQKYALVPEGENTLSRVMASGNEKQNKVKALIAKNDISLTNSTAAMYQFVTTLNIDPESINTDYMDHWAASVKKRMLLDEVVNKLLPQTVSELTYDLTGDTFKDYVKSTNKMIDSLISVTSDIAEGTPTMVASSLDLEEITSTLLLSDQKVGGFIDLNLEQVNRILNQGEKNITFLSRDTGPVLLELREKILNRYTDQSEEVSFEATNTLAQAIDQNCRVMGMLLDNLRLIIGVYNRLIETAVAKNNVLDAYGMFLESLVE